MSKVHPNAAPFYLEGPNSQACLLIHGFSGSPSEIRPLGQYLQELGYTVSCPLLPGHGTQVEDLADKTWQEWYAAVEQEYFCLKERFGRVVPIGLSMGGALALHLAYRQKIQGAVTLSAPIYMNNRKAFLAPILKYFRNSHQKPISPETWEGDLKKGQFYYLSYPLTAVHSFLQLIRTLRKELGEIHVPLLIMHSQVDRTVRAKSAQYLYDHLASTRKKLVWLENSSHVITLGRERQLVYEEVAGFLASLEPKQED